MTDERRIADPKDVAPRDLEEEEIQAEGDTNKDQTARDDPPPAETARADLPGEKSKETPRASSFLPELLQKMSATLDALLESAERQNRANRIITDELRSIGADVRAQPLEISLFRKPAAQIDPVALNFTTPGGSSSRPRDDGSVRRVARNADLPEEKAAQRTTTRTKHADPHRMIQQRFSAFDDDDLARRVVPDTMNYG
ncbi:hypothetical protein AALP_AA6G283000 [Arabis alpina]|uniref:Uncharacterized protein n=1 Tax=Arabis alpina TaxID=50452 RepID=A0A087GS90_ARAAL|nr:hypothetical protein AALP_AA6G283000 [Arabis alpina]